MTKSFEQQLKMANGLFAGGKKSVKEGFKNIPDGRYIAKLVSATMGESKASSQLQTILEFVVKDGNESGTTVRKFCGMTDEQKMGYLLGDLACFGYDADVIDNIEDVQKILEELTTDKPLCKITCKKTKTGYHGTYIDQVINNDFEPPAEEPELVDAEAEEEEEATIEDEDDGLDVIETGMIASFMWRKKERSGTITKLMPDDGKVRVQIEVGGKQQLVDISVDKIEVSDADVEDMPF